MWCWFSGQNERKQILPVELIYIKNLNFNVMFDFLKIWGKRRNEKKIKNKFKVN